MRAQQVLQLTHSAHFTVDAKFNLKAPELKTFHGFSTGLEAFSNQTQPVTNFGGGARKISKQRTKGLNVPIPTSYDRNTSWNPLATIFKWSRGSVNVTREAPRTSDFGGVGITEGVRPEFPAEATPHFP